MQKRTLNLSDKLKFMLVLTVAIALLLALVPTPAGACDDLCSCWEDPANDGETWYLRGNSELNNAPGTGFISDVTYVWDEKDAWWYSPVAAGEVIYPDTDHWTLWLRFYNVIDAGGTLTVTLYDFDPDTDTLGPILAQNTYDTPLSSEIQCKDIILEDQPGPQAIPEGHQLALQLSYSGGGTLVFYDSSYACSRLEGSAPVPEWSTIVLMGMGLLGLGGYACYRVKRSRKISV